MQITTFNPMILSPKADEVIALFEELGFEKHHTPVTQTETAQMVPASAAVRIAVGSEPVYMAVW